MEKNTFRGIYRIKNIINNKSYVGQSKNLLDRKKQHFYYLRKNKHKNRHLQNAYNKYGEENFVFEILLICEEENITYYEQKCVDIFKPEYNIRKECVNSNDGIKFSDESKKRMSDSKKGKPGKKHSEETKKRMSEDRKGERGSFYGRHHTQETKEKISFAHSKENLSDETIQKLSDAKKGKKMSKEFREKMSEITSGENHPMYGKHHTEETKQKIRENRKPLSGENHPMYGRHHSEESKRKISENSKGRKCTEEAKKKMSESRKGRVSPNKGKKASPETRAKMSASRKKRKTALETKAKFFNSMVGRKIKKDSSSKHVGVNYNKRILKWTSRINDHGKRLFLGNFETEQEAIDAYDKKWIDIYGGIRDDSKLR